MPALRGLTTPRAAALAGVLFALMFGTSLVLMRSALPAGAEPGSQWIGGATTRLRIASLLMPFAGIAFLWFMGVIRDAIGALEDRFFSTVLIGSGLLFIAMMFTTTAIGVSLVASSSVTADPAVHASVAEFGRTMLEATSTTYGLRMAAVFMISLATIWLKTGLMSRGLVATTYAVALIILVASEISTWLVLAFPIWVLAVSVLVLERGGVIRSVPIVGVAALHYRPELVAGAVGMCRRTGGMPAVTGPITGGGTWAGASCRAPRWRR